MDKASLHLWRGDGFAVDHYIGLYFAVNEYELSISLPILSFRVVFQFGENVFCSFVSLKYCPNKLVSRAG